MQLIPDDAASDTEKFIQPFEGFSATPYPDPGTGGKPWTIGYGSTRDENGNPITPNTPAITSAQAALLLMRDLHEALYTIANDVKVPLSSNEWIALGSFVYNVGSGNFASSTLLKFLNAGNYEAAAQQLERWDMSNGQVLAGLLRRRLAEEKEFNTPNATT